MSIGSYRSEYEAQLRGRAALRSAEPVGGRNFAEGLGPGTTAEAANRLDAIERTTAKGEAPGMTIAALVATLANGDEAPPVREAALAKLKELEFSSAVLDPHRADYVEALRKAARSGSGNLALDALEVLAMGRDPFAHDVLLEFLRNPASAPFPLAQVIQLLSYDDHGDVAEAIRNVVRHGEDSAVVEESLRLLSSDAESQDLFVELLQDKSQPTEVRTLSANGLHNVNPKRFAAMAKKIVDDAAENDDLRAACLSTLTHFSDYADERLNKSFAKRVEKLEQESSSVNLRATASRYRERLIQGQE